jgi:NAD(P)-dependent dehydrogenase (short-subunit alcohol dehydrogenase family)
MENKIFLVTGASSGIGRAISVMLSEKGASVILTGRNEAELQKTLQCLKDKSKHVLLPCNLESQEEISALVSSVAERYGKIDGFVHSAGICPVMPAAIADRSQFIKAMNVNCFAFQDIMALLVKSGLAQKGFAAVAVSSVSAVTAWPGSIVYSSSKAALSAMVRSMALEFAAAGLRINSVSPSNVKTPMLDALTVFKTPEALKKLESSQPLGFGEPSDVAGAVSFLLSEEARFVTGIDMPVDGGYLLQ